ncbi:hypothetical protein N869_16850 [Cellulomonas bogoriensis 69B4 = DSM 16987]|uniref:MFS transporter n=1 Tax=Cellulomonas bogoriensis 69B4 = DSM 16987 TaxID=1386082 RepID=A0A0A0C0P4_9CELL|nr:hypothetical protein N869_16850 [Cellulomonas bogoriensis 69B4 = DSM 16987]
MLGSGAAETASDQVVKGVLPVVAVSTLGAGATAVGVINAASMVAFLLVSVPVGVWIDRVSRTRVMTGAALVRAVVVLAVPLLYVADALTVTAIVVVALVIGVADVFFTTSSSALMPGIVPQDRLPDAYARRQSVDTTVAVATPAVAAVLLRVVGGPFTMVLASASYVCSALSLRRIRPAHVPAPAEGAPRFWASLREGFGFTVRQPLVRALVGSGMLLNAAAIFGAAAEVVYALNVLGIDPAVLVATEALGALGGLAASLVAAPVVRRAGIGRTYMVACLVGGLVVLVLPLSPVLGIPPVVAVAVVAGGWSFSVVTAAVAKAGVVPALTPPAMLGRVMSNAQFFTLGVMPVAAVAGGLVADVAGPEVALYIWAGAAVLALVPIALSPMRSWVTPPSPSGTDLLRFP